MPSPDQPTGGLHTSCGTQRLPEIVLLGSAANFSASLVQATRRHVRDLHLLHLPSLDALAALTSQQTGLLRLLVIDDITMANASPAVVRSVTLRPGITMALAFRDHAVALRCYHAPAALMPIDSYVPLDVCLDIWLSICSLLLNGGKYVPEELLISQCDGSAGGHSGAAGADPRLGLTQRQYDVLQLVAAGHQNKMIARHLGMSDHTVKLHIHNIIGRLGVTNRTQAAARFYEKSR